MAEQETPQGLTDDELEAQNAEALPDREAMSVISPEPGVGIHDLELEGNPPLEPDKGPVPGGHIDY